MLDVSLAPPLGGGSVLIHHTGTPSAGLLFDDAVMQAAQHGLRLISYARPGYDGSERQAGRSVADCAADVAAVADALGAERFYVSGHSGGGPHALVTAALLGQRVIAAATLGGAAPWDAEGLDFLDGMGEENHVEFGAAAAGESELRAYLEAQAHDLAAVSGGQLTEAFGQLAAEIDRRALSGEYADFLATQLRVAISHGVDGWVDDDLAFVHDWGFDLHTATMPVTVWQGYQDHFVPADHGRWLAAHIPGARMRFLPDHGHLSLERYLWGEVLDGLLASDG